MRLAERTGALAWAAPVSHRAGFPEDHPHFAGFLPAAPEALSERLRLLLDALPGGVVVLDGNGLVVEANPAARRWLGDQLTGLAWPAGTAENPRPGLPAEPTKVMVEGEVAVTIPAGWITQRVIGGPGSARVQITSPSDPEAALHITQTPTPTPPATRSSRLRSKS